MNWEITQKVLENTTIPVNKSLYVSKIWIGFLLKIIKMSALTVACCSSVSSWTLAQINRVKHQATSSVITWIGITWITWKCEKVHMKNVCDSVSKSTWPLLVNFQKIGNRYFFQELKAWPNLVVWRKNIRIFCENRYTSSKRNISRGWAREVRLAHSQIWMSHITLNGHIFKTDNLVKRSLI